VSWLNPRQGCRSRVISALLLIAPCDSGGRLRRWGPAVLSSVRGVVSESPWGHSMF
jgi:hypothetical protein